MSETDDIDVLEREDSSAPVRAFDALLHAVAWMTRHYRHERTVQYLVAGMNLQGELAPDQAVQILRQEGYNAGLAQRSLTDIQPDMLPAMALLKNRDACIIKSRLPNNKGFEVVWPGPDCQTIRATQSELEPEYAGFLLLVAPKPEDAARPVPTFARPQRRLSEMMLSWMNLQRIPR